MASLLEIKKKIGGVKNTRKITKAMQLVAASKMQYFQKRAMSLNGFINGLTDLLESNLQGEGKSMYTQTPKSDKVLFVLYTSDKGLCGALNNKLLSTFSNSKEWNDTPEKNRLLVTIGKKSNEFAKRRGIPVEEYLTGFSEKLETLESLNLVDKILQIWKDQRVKQVIFINPHFKNSFTYYPVIKQYLPLNQEMLKTQVTEREVDLNKADIVFEPSEEHLTEKLHEMIVQSFFMQSFIELKAAEYSSRMLAMKNATDAADKIIKNLTLSYNKARQQAITQQIAELVGATAAIQN
jgi:F-type H+-transporting ATPase subunit gamma